MRSRLSASILPLDQIAAHSPFRGLFDGGLQGPRQKVIRTDLPSSYATYIDIRLREDATVNVCLFSQTPSGRVDSAYQMASGPLDPILETLLSGVRLACHLGKTRTVSLHCNGDFSEILIPAGQCIFQLKASGVVKMQLELPRDFDLARHLTLSPPATSLESLELRRTA